MQITDVIIKPYLTEKTYIKRDENFKKYAFIVDIKANKYLIASAFELIFKIKPLKISTMIRKSVAIKTGTKNPGMSNWFKIAYISLPKGKDIAITKQEAEEKITKAKKINTSAKEITKPSVSPAKEITKTKKIKDNMKEKI